MNQARHNSGETADDPNTGTDPGLRATLMETVLGVHRVVGSTVELAAMEAQRAFSAAGWIMALCIGVAVCVLAAWSLLVAALAFWLVAQGLNWGQSLLLLVGLNVLAAAVMVVAIRRLVLRLGFPVLRRTLFRDDGSQQDEDRPHTAVGAPYPE